MNMCRGHSFPSKTEDNDYLMDREAQKADTLFSVSKALRCRMPVCRNQWARSVTGPVKTLVSTDNGIIMARNLLRKAVTEFQKNGTTPPGVDPSHHHVRSVASVLEPDEKYMVALADALRSDPGKERTSV